MNQKFTPLIVLCHFNHSFLKQHLLYYFFSSNRGRPLRPKEVLDHSRKESGPDEGAGYRHGTPLFLLTETQTHSVLTHSITGYYQSSEKDHNQN